jgi:hypothetical protein
MPIPPFASVSLRKGEQLSCFLAAHSGSWHQICVASLILFGNLARHVIFNPQLNSYLAILAESKLAKRIRGGIF